MKRARGCLTAYPAGVETKDDDVIFNMSVREAGEVYSKLLLADHGDILSIIARESKELEGQIADDENCPERCFIEQAIGSLKEREASVLEKIGDDCIIHKGKTLGSNSNESRVDTADEGVGEVGDLVDSENISANNANQQSKFHYFYQGKPFFTKTIRSNIYVNAFFSVRRTTYLFTRHQC